MGPSLQMTNLGEFISYLLPPLHRRHPENRKEASADGFTFQREEKCRSMSARPDDKPGIKGHIRSFYWIDWKLKKHWNIFIQNKILI